MFEKNLELLCHGCQIGNGVKVIIIENMNVISLFIHLINVWKFNFFTEVMFIKFTFIMKVRFVRFKNGFIIINSIL